MDWLFDKAINADTAFVTIKNASDSLNQYRELQLQRRQFARTGDCTRYEYLCKLWAQAPKDLL